MRLIFTSSYLTPGERLTEVFCGLVMVLSFTLVAGFEAPEGRAGVHALLEAAVGCNVAWGIIDGVLFLMNRLFERQRYAQLVAALKNAGDERARRAVLDEALAPPLVARMTGEQSRQVFSALHAVASELPPITPHLTRRDAAGALGCFVLCVATTIPAAVPFLLFDTPKVALRVSNAILLASLFVVGTIWAQEVGRRRVPMGLALLLVGAAMVAIAIAFGG